MTHLTDPISLVLSFSSYPVAHGMHTVPIIPEFLYDIRHPDAPLDSFPRTPLTTPRPTSSPCDGPGSALVTEDDALAATAFAVGKSQHA